MSSPSQTQPALPAEVPNLLSLRAELNRLDDAPHDTSMRWPPRPKGALTTQGLAVSAAAPDPSGRDRSSLKLELADDDRMRLGTAWARPGFALGW